MGDVFHLDLEIWVCLKIESSRVAQIWWLIIFNHHSPCEKEAFYGLNPPFSDTQKFLGLPLETTTSTCPWHLEDLAVSSKVVGLRLGSKIGQPAFHGEKAAVFTMFYHVSPQFSMLHQMFFHSYLMLPLSAFLFGRIPILGHMWCHLLGLRRIAPGVLQGVPVTASNLSNGSLINCNRKFLKSRPTFPESQLAELCKCGMLRITAELVKWMQTLEAKEKKITSGVTFRYLFSQSKLENEPPCLLWMELGLHGNDMEWLIWGSKYFPACQSA